MAFFRFFCLQSKVYKSVVDDVITNVKEFFRDEGVDDQVLDELKAVRTDSKKKELQLLQVQVKSRAAIILTREFVFITVVGKEASHDQSSTGCSG